MPYLLVKNRDKILFDGEVDNVTSYNQIGIFNILQDHSNFITIIEKKIMISKNHITKEIPVTNGLVKVHENKIYIYIGIK